MSQIEEENLEFKILRRHEDVTENPLSDDVISITVHYSG